MKPANELEAENKRLRELLSEARQYVQDRFNNEAEAMRGYLHISHCPAIDGFLRRIDEVLERWK